MTALINVCNYNSYSHVETLPSTHTHKIVLSSVITKHTVQLLEMHYSRAFIPLGLICLADHHLEVSYFLLKLLEDMRELCGLFLDLARVFEP